MSDPSAQGLNFESCPAIFVLPTHLTLEELHQIEETLTQHHAQLTYDVSEARLILGKIGHKKRAALELRTRGVWTEEVLPPSEPPTKRRRLHGETQSHTEEIDLSTETEGEEDGVRSKHDPKRHLARPAISPLRLPEQADVHVAKLDWLDACLNSNKLSPIAPYIIYQARKTGRPQPAAPNTTKSSAIIQRAKQDAVAHGHDSPTPTRSSQRPLPKLYRQTTSETDEGSEPLPAAPAWVKNHILYACQRSAPLHPPNEGFIDQLLAIRKIRELTLDEVGVRAYSTSIAAVAAYPYEFRRASEVLTLPGCDTKIANLFAEYQRSDTRTLEAATALTTDPVLRVLHAFDRIWGVGPKTARDFYYARGWRDLDDIVTHGWASLSRVQQIGVKYYDEFAAGIPRAEVEAIARVVHRHANAVRPDAGRSVECILVGGYRRGKESSGDVDLILTHRDEAVTMNLVVDVVGSLEDEGWITHTLALNLMSSAREQQPLPFRGESAGAHHFDSLDKALVVWQDPRFDEGSADGDGAGEDEYARRKRNPNPHRRVDIIISPWRTVGCAVLGWTGDTTFERDLRRYAKKAHGWKFDSSGVRERTSGGQVLDLEAKGRTWEERERLVMEGLGVGWREPGERCSR
ncbi:hypothetical protein BDV59DRAFT_121092 [Aspergillus ambiguus]|uniref:type-X family DNA polymerase n=1 Tax=Aspergillus ambiguus TaxID=176160 RepID=UPI003CCDA283